MFRNWEWADTWGVILGVTVITFIGLVVTSITADHTVKNYYMSSKQNSVGGACIVSNVPWASDELVTCSDDVPTLILELEVLNRDLQKKTPSSTPVVPSPDSVQL